jgi:hypothetical protein
MEPSLLPSTCQERHRKWALGAIRATSDHSVPRKFRRANCFKLEYEVNGKRGKHQYVVDLLRNLVFAVVLAGIHDLVLKKEKQSPRRPKFFLCDLCDL